MGERAQDGVGDNQEQEEMQRLEESIRNFATFQQTVASYPARMDSINSRLDNQDQRMNRMDENMKIVIAQNQKNSSDLATILKHFDSLKNRDQQIWELIEETRQETRQDPRPYPGPHPVLREPLEDLQSEQQPQQAQFVDPPERYIPIENQQQYQVPNNYKPPPMQNATTGHPPQ